MSLASFGKLIPLGFLSIFSKLSMLSSFLAGASSFLAGETTFGVSSFLLPDGSNSRAGFALAGAGAGALTHFLTLISYVLVSLPE